MEIPQSLLDASGLTAVQIESLLSYTKVKSKELTLREAAGSRTRGRNEGPVKIGSYYRTVEQGKRNLERAVATVVVGVWMGAIKSEDLMKLFNMAGGKLGRLEGEGAEMAAEVILRVAKSVVTL